MELHLPFSDPEQPGPEEVKEQSVLEYAREQGICVDYTTELPTLVDLCLSLKHTIDQDLSDPFDDELANAVTAANQLLTQKVAFPVPKDAASILRTLRAVEAPLTSGSLAAEGLQRIRDLKQELPLLQTDVELDMLSFGTKVVLDLGDLRTRLPSEDLDEENDEGFEWSEKYFAYPALCDAKVKSERLAVTREALELLQNAMSDEVTREDDKKMLADALESRRALVPRYLTPPLLPLSPPTSPYIPSSPANRLPLIPDSSDSVAAEAKALEQQIMAKDSLLRPHSGSSESMLLDDGNLDVGDFDALFDVHQARTPSSSDRIPQILKRKVDELKVEGPLTPPMFSDSPTKKLKSVSFSTMIQVGKDLEPWVDENRSEVSGSQNTTDELLKEIEPIAKKMNVKVENEKLTGADTIARVEVPCLDFTLLVAPWDEFSQRKDSKHRWGATELEAQMRFLQSVKRKDLKSATAWRGVSDLDLKWGWFASPSSSTITLHEKLHGETEFNKIQTELKTGNIASSSKEVWKRDGIRLLDEVDEDEDEEDIEPADYEERTDMDSLIRKRKLELDEQGQFVEGQRKLRSIVIAPPEAPHQQSQPPVPHRNTTRQDIAPTELMFGTFSASTALHKFMETQGKAIKAASCNPKATSAITTQARVSDETGPNALSDDAAIAKLGNIIEHPVRPTAEPTPAFDLPACSFVISSAMLQRRPLVKEVERLHPNAELIYRDYSLPHSDCVEADLILSPSTGVLLTTLQQIKQMPLPGQAARSPVKERMAMLQERYEILVVLVSEGLREESGYSRPEDARDLETLKNLEIFTAKLEGDVSVELVRGGEKMLARAMVETMAKYGLPHGGKVMGDIKLLPVESTWEVFLRRAGLNPFAAQAIIACLKTPITIASPQLSSSPVSYAPQRTLEATGLSTFLLMEREVRATRFQAILGGRRILDRVSALLDQRWLSAAHGFRM